MGRFIFALCWLVKLLRLFSLIACSFLLQAAILNYCTEIGVHYKAVRWNDGLCRLGATPSPALPKNGGS
jgi:hypothetical protein